MGSTDNNNLTVEGLMTMTPVFQGVDIVGAASRQLLLSRLKSQPHVAEIFFPNHKKEALEDQVQDAWFDYEFFSTILVCQAVGDLSDSYGIHSMLDLPRINEIMSNIYRSPEWKKIGFALYTLLFPDLVKDIMSHVPFRAYMDSDRQSWALKLSERMRDKKWIYTVIGPVVRGHYTDSEYNRDLNIQFIKLHLLDPTTVMPTFNYLTKALPDLNLGLVTTNYLGGPIDTRVLRDEITLAVSKATYAHGVSSFSLEEVELFYGVSVVEFITAHAKDLGVWTGKYPDNKRISNFKDRCSLMNYCTIL